jgi:hypothetical protein
MKTMSLLLTIVASLCLSTAAWGQRTLSSAEVQQILQKVTSQPRKTWISVGTIVATHQEYGVPKTTDPTTIQQEINKAVQQYQNNPSKIEQTAALQKMKLDAIPFNVRYKLSNEWAMSSHVTVKYDNDRFYWEINVDSRQDSIKPDATLAGNYMTAQFNLSWNQRRIFAWDGQEYTTYSVSGGQATVDAAGKLPRAVTGPLTAGLIPWGYTRFSSASLTAAQISAKQNTAGTIDMTISYTDGTSASLTLDPAKVYAVTKATLTSAGGSTATYTCSGYQQVAGNWVPFTITIERRNAGFNSKLPTSEQWTFTSVSTAAPGSFNVPLMANALVEYCSPITASSAIYAQSNTVETRGLLVQRLAYAAAQGSRQKNCATAAVQAVASELGKSIPDSALARLVGPDGRTSMYDMKRLAQSQGLFCRAVKTDLATLRSLNGVKAILHFPGKNHFVVLNEVNDRDVWVTDLSSRKFFYHQSVDFFPMDWSESTALLLWDRPISSQPSELPDAALASIAGGTGWDCNQLLQENDAAYCDSNLLTGCDGAVTIYFERWGCGSAPSGSCNDHQLMVSSQETPCIWDPDWHCSVTGEWYYYYMSACA